MIKAHWEVSMATLDWEPPWQAATIRHCYTHGSYNLEKVLNFSSRLEKSLISVKVLEKYLISLLQYKPEGLQHYTRVNCV